jgi:phosphoglycolate phosphatase-like HAD superfamily hydrolase
VTDSIKAIVFDFDGVIVESADVKTDAFVELFSAYGPDVAAAVKAHHLANMGISRFVKFAWIYQNLLEKPLPEAESAALGERFTALALDKVLAAPFVPGAETALAALVPRYPLFVASGTPQGELDLIVDRRGLRGVFREVHGTPREKPAILADLLVRHGLGAAQVLFVGDGLSDYNAAAATGVEFLARDTPPLHDRWAALGVKRRPDLTELVALVEAW